MKRFAVVAIALAVAACAGEQSEGTDTAAPAAGAVEAASPASDSAIKADSAAEPTALPRPTARRRLAPRRRKATSLGSSEGRDRDRALLLFRQVICGRPTT